MCCEQEVLGFFFLSWQNSSSRSQQKTFVVSTLIKQVKESLIVSFWLDSLQFIFRSFSLLLLLQHLRLLTSSVFLSFLLSFLINVRPQPLQDFSPPPPLPFSLLLSLCLFPFFLDYVKYLFSFLPMTFRNSFPYSFAFFLLYLPVILNYFLSLPSKLKKKNRPILYSYHITETPLKDKTFFSNFYFLF